MLVDSHCHIQDKDYPIDVDLVLENALNSGVSRVVAVGTDLTSSRRAVDLATKYNQVTGSRAEVFAVIGVHPSEIIKNDIRELDKIFQDTPPLKRSRIIGVGEIGLDYHYDNQSRKRQIGALEWQIDFALKNDLAIEFHVRDAFFDFWPVLNNFSIKRADVHSFTDNRANAEEALRRGFYIGLNGISTFTKINWQKQLYSDLPLESILFETDAPYLTPAPFRGKINEPARIRQIAEYHAAARQIPFDVVTDQTSQNFESLFDLK